MDDDEDDMTPDMVA